MKTRDVIEERHERREKDKGENDNTGEEEKEEEEEVDIYAPVAEEEIRYNKNEGNNTHSDFFKIISHNYIV